MVTDILKDHVIETKEGKLVDAEGHEVDHRNVNHLDFGRNGEGLEARFTPVELTLFAQAVDEANELFHPHVHIEVTTTHLPTLISVVLLALTETPTFPSYDHILGRRLLHLQTPDTLHRTSVLCPEIDLQGQEKYLWNARVQTVAHLLIGGLKKRVNFLCQATVLYLALVFHQRDTKSQVGIKSDHHHCLGGDQEIRIENEDRPDLPQREKEQEEAAQGCNLLHVLRRTRLTMGHVHPHLLDPSQVTNHLIITRP